MSAYNAVRRRRMVVVALAVIVVIPLLAASTLSPVRLVSSGVSQASADQGGVDEEPDPHEQHAQYVKEYGDIGCRVVVGFNDRCPTMISEPYSAPGDEGRYHQPSLLAGSPDGGTMYAVGVENVHDDDGNVNKAMSLVAYRMPSAGPAEAARIAWTQTYVGPGTLSGRATSPQDVVVSHDGQRVYVAGYVYYPGMDLPYEGWVASFDTADGGLVWERDIRDLVGSSSQPVSGVSGVPWIQAYDLALSPDDSALVLSTMVQYPFADRARDATQHVWHQSWNAWYFSLDANSGNVLWKSTYDGPDPNRPNLRADSMEFAPTGSNDQNLWMVLGEVT